MSAGRTTLLFRLVEGAGIALDSLRSNKVRAALTILGVAIGVMVVIAMGSAITGINRSITNILESAGPKTFFVTRYFRADWRSRTARTSSRRGDGCRRSPSKRPSSSASSPRCAT